MSNATVTSVSKDPRSLRSGLRSSLPLKWIILAALAVVLLIAPLYLSSFWLQLGFSVAAIGVGAIGLNLVTGAAGQLSLANPFFMAIGALSYVTLAGESNPDKGLIGLGLPPLLAFVGAAALSGLCGLAFSPLSGRLRGIYLGIASLGLVYVAIHVFNTATAFSGGYNGRTTPPFSMFGLSFGNSDNPLVVLGVPFQRNEMLWYLGILVLSFAAWFAVNVLKGRPGRAMKLVARSELSASVISVHVTATKGKVFFLSSVYAGVAGVLYALSIGSIAPQSFGLELSLQFLAMIVIGGMGSVAGSIIGAAFVMSLPLILQVVASDLPIFSLSFSSSHLAKYIYGLAIILVLIFKPAGIIGIWESIVAALKRRRAPEGRD